MRKWTRYSFILLILLVAGSILTVNAQQSTLLDSKLPIHSDWSAFFPLFEGCEAQVQPISNSQGQIVQNATFKEKELKPGPGEIIVGMPLTGLPWLDSGECGSIQIIMRVPYFSPKAVLSERELRAAKKRERKQKKIQKKLARYFEGFKHMRPSAPPRLITIKGFEAYQIFGPSCDYYPCEDSYFTTISVKFASDKQLMIRVRGNFEKASQITERTDFKNLISAMDAYANTMRQE